MVGTRSGITIPTEVRSKLRTLTRAGSSRPIEPFAEKFGSRWVILSAKYGFIRPDFQIPGPYNVSFKDPATQPVEIHTLIDQIKDLGLGEAKRIIGLGGKEYRAKIKEAFAPFGCPLRFPFAGLGIGEMIQATKGAIESDKLSG